MDDLISRQAVIKAIHDEYDECLKVDESGAWIANNIEDIINTIPSLPSRPQIIHCKDCKHWHKRDDITYCDRIDYGYGYKPDDFCSYAELR